MNVKKVILMAAVLVMSCTLFAGCGKKTDESGSGGSDAGNSGSEKKTIAVVPWAMEQEFASTFAYSCKDLIEENGWEAVILDPEGDWAKCVQILEDLIVQQVDGIIYTAIDTDAASDMVDKVKAAGIPIIDYDCLAAAGNADASIACDDYKGGQMAAELVMEAVKGKEDAKVVIFEEEPSIVSSGKRVNGFTEYLDDNYPNVEYIKNRTTDRTREGCYNWAIDMYTTYPDVDAFFCYWGDSAIGAWNGLQSVNAKDVYLVGYDATDEEHQIMLDEGPDGHYYASIAMFPEEFANQCVSHMKMIMDGEYERKGPEDIIMFDPEILKASEAENWKK